MSKRKVLIKEFADKMASVRKHWINKNSYFHNDDQAYHQFLIPPDLKVLDLGCGMGDLLNACRPSIGVGIDISEKMVDAAKEQYPDHQFLHGDIEDKELLDNLEGPFDVILMSDTIGYLEDYQSTLESLHSLCSIETRIIISYYSMYWEPILEMGEKLGLKMPSIEYNWISTEDTLNFLHLAGFEPVKREWRQLLPKKLLGLGPLINHLFGALPFIRRFSLRSYVVARSIHKFSAEELSATVLIPCRNEAGNIENAVKRIPDFCDDLEILYVEGNSQDNTVEEIQRVIEVYPEKKIKFLQQDGEGKGDAVRKGFAHAKGDVLMILDADLTVPPEELPKFYDAIVSGKGEYINGTRLVYPMEEEAMRFLNFWANRIFSVLFSWLLNQRITDTLCGTKVLTRDNYNKIVANRSYFGNFDPFGDFDLIFGASKLNLKIQEVPIRYAAREYGETQISRFRHGWLLLKMVVFAYRKLKVV